MLLFISSAKVPSQGRKRATSASMLPLPRLTSSTPTAAVNVPSHSRQFSTSSSTGLEKIAEDDTPAVPPTGRAAERASRRRHTVDDTAMRGQLLKSPLLAEYMKRAEAT